MEHNKTYFQVLAEIFSGDHGNIYKDLKQIIESETHKRYILKRSNFYMKQKWWPNSPLKIEFKQKYLNN